MKKSSMDEICNITKNYVSGVTDNSGMGALLFIDSDKVELHKLAIKIADKYYSNA